MCISTHMRCCLRVLKSPLAAETPNEYMRKSAQNPPEVLEKRACNRSGPECNVKCPVSIKLFDAGDVLSETQYCLSAVSGT